MWFLHFQPLLVADTFLGPAEATDMACLRRTPPLLSEQQPRSGHSVTVPEAQAAAGSAPLTPRAGPDAVANSGSTDSIDGVSFLLAITFKLRTDSLG